MTDDGRAGHHFARAGWNFAEESVKETGAKLALPSACFYQPREQENSVK